LQNNLQQEHRASKHHPQCPQQAAEAHQNIVLQSHLVPWCKQNRQRTHSSHVEKQEICLGSGTRAGIIWLPQAPAEIGGACIF
jgi:hypothetical protein